MASATSPPRSSGWRGADRGQARTELRLQVGEGRRSAPGRDDEPCAHGQGDRHRCAADRLRKGCPEFEGWWEAHDIGVVAGRKQLSHPGKGALRYDYATFQDNDDPALKLTIYAPA